MLFASAQGRRWLYSAGRARSLRHQVDAWRQVRIFAALADRGGALGAIGQSNIKRLLAYSSINNVGFILIGSPRHRGRRCAMLVYLAITAMTGRQLRGGAMMKDGRRAARRHLGSAGRRAPARRSRCAWRW
jgi:NADH:ubiquinone oxidoreductase subunit 2 (subunit N)